MPTPESDLPEPTPVKAWFDPETTNGAIVEIPIADLDTIDERYPQDALVNLIVEYSDGEQHRPYRFIDTQPVLREEDGFLVF